METGIIDRYGKLKDDEKVIKKELGSISEQLKSYMDGTKQEVAEGGDYVVKLTHKVIEDIDEAMMLSLIKKAWTAKNGSMQCPFIRTVEVLDADALEGAIYRGEIDPDLIADLGKCKTTKTQLMLTYKKKKGE